MKEDTVDNINRPAHYQPLFKAREIECIDIARLLPYDLGCAFKYIWRAGRKGDKEQAIEDLNKAQWYIRDYEKLEKSEMAQSWNFTMSSATFKRVEAVNSKRYYFLQYIADGCYGFIRYDLGLLLQQEDPISILDEVWKQ